MNKYGVIAKFDNPQSIVQAAQQVRNERKAEVENAKAVHEIENIQKQSQSRKERRKATKKN